MNRFALVLALAMTTCIASAQKRSALLVAVDEYPSIRGEKRVATAEGDLATMRGVCGSYRFTPQELRNSQATATAIVKRGQELADAVKPGDVVLFYFSGRGGRAPAASGLEATLVPHQASPTTGSDDVRLSTLRQWSETIDKKGGKAIFVLDACWNNKLSPRSVEARPYNPYPRYLDRGAKDDPAPIDLGKASALLAADHLTSTYEWDSGEGEYVGTFTDMLGKAVSVAAARSQPLNLEQLSAEVSRVSGRLVRQGYMPGFVPVVLKGKDVTLGKPEIPAGSALQAAYDKYRQGLAKYTIAVDVPESVEDAPTRNALYREARAALRRFVEGGHAQSVALVDRRAYPDRVIQVAKDGAGKWTIETRDDMQARIAREAAITADTWDEALTELGPRIERDALITLLYRQITSTTPSLEGDWKVSFGTEFKLNQRFVGEVTAPSPCHVFWFDQTDALGSITLQLPDHVQRSVGAAPSAPFEITAADKWEFNERSPVGRGEASILLVDRATVQLPALDASDPKSFRSELIPFLSKLLDQIRAGTAKWSSKSHEYHFNPSQENL